MQRQHLVMFCVCFGSLFCGSLFIYLMLLVGFKNIRKCLIKKIIQGEDVTLTDVLSCYGYVSIKKHINFH